MPHPFSRSIRGFLPWSLGIVVAAGAGTAWAQVPAPTSPPPEVLESSGAVPVVLTISGGISLGSYQSGVNWALIEFFRHTYHDPAFAQDLGIRPHRLAAATGASAGNINAVLSALEWCRAYVPGERRLPSESLFWHTWTTTGWEQVFSPGRGNPRSAAGAGRGVFHRGYFREGHFGRIREWMGGQPQEAGCTVPLGITLTMLRRDSITLNARIHPATQRFVSLLEAHADPARGPGVVFRQPPADLAKRGSLGRVALAPSGAGGIIDPDSVFPIVEASSAFPVAFEPVRLSYVDPQVESACLASGAECRATHREAFLDGGVFDNNPLSLAFELLRASRGGAIDSAARVIYIDPDQLRDTLASVGLTRRRDDRPAQGLRVALGMAGAAVPAARQYELQSLARTLAGDGLRDQVKVTSRGHPLVSEHLGAFAGFLGKPFRQFDFYVGVYDGLFYVADEIVCARRQEDRSACTRRELYRLVRGGRPEVGDEARRVLERIYEFEYLDGLDPAPAGLPPREVMLHALVDATVRNLAPPDPALCRGRGVMEQMMCREGFEGLMRDFATPRVRAAVRAASAERPCRDPVDYVAAATACDADLTLRRLVDEQGRFVTQRAGQLISRLSYVEDGIDDERGAHLEPLIELMESVYLGMLGRPQRGLDLDPSSIPDRRLPALETLAHFLPHYVMANVASVGTEVGYRPTYRLSSRWGVTVPLAYRYGPVEDGGPRDHLLAGVLVQRELKPDMVTIEAGFYRMMPAGQALEGEFHSTPATEVALSLAQQLRLGLRCPHLPSRCSVDDLQLTVGLLNLNGLLYWASRLPN